jgi:hypothetical protein
MGIQKDLELSPMEYILEQNYPNPFNPSTTIDFGLPEAARVQMTIHDLLGRELARIIDGTLEAGAFKYVYNATGLSGGMYLYRLTAIPGGGGAVYNKTKKFLFLK